MVVLAPCTTSVPLKTGLLVMARVLLVKPPPAVPLTEPTRLPVPLKLKTVLPWAAVLAVAPYSTLRLGVLPAPPLPAVLRPVKVPKEAT